MNNVAVETLVWLGAGEALAPIDLQRIKADRIYLIEAQKDLCVTLNSLDIKASEINVINCVVSDEKKTALFNRYNLPEFSALSDASGLYQIFPGLAKEASDSVTTTAIADLIINLELSETLNNQLMIDFSDSAGILLKTLLNANLLHHFGSVIVQSSIAPLYEGAATTSEIIDFFEESGFELVGEDNNDPDMPMLSFKQNPLWLKFVETENSKMDLELELKIATRQITANEAELQKQHSEFKNKLETIEADKAVLQQQLNAVIAEAKKANVLLAEQRMQASSEIAEVKKQLAVVDADRLKQHSEFKNRLEATETEDAALQQQLKAAVTETEKANAILAEQQEVFEEKLKAENIVRESLENQLAVAEQSKTELETVYLNFQSTAKEQQKKLSLEFEEKKKWLSEHEKWNAGLKTEIEELAVDCSELEKTVAENAKLLEEKQHIAAEWEKKAGEQQYRNQMLEKEIIKLEAQLELVKDVILRDKAF